MYSACNYKSFVFQLCVVSIFFSKDFNYTLTRVSYAKIFSKNKKYKIVRTMF